MSRRKGHVERSVKALDKLLQHSEVAPLWLQSIHGWCQLSRTSLNVFVPLMTRNQKTQTRYPHANSDSSKIRLHSLPFRAFATVYWTYIQGLLFMEEIFFFFFSFLTSVHRSMVVCYVLFIRDCHYCHKPSKTLMFFYSFHAALIKCAHKRPNRVHPFKGGMDHCLFLSLILY